MSEALTGELILNDEDNWPELYRDGGLQKYIDELKKNLPDEIPDVETEKGRERIGSLARKVSSSKSAVEKPGREYLRKLKARVKPAEQELKRWVDFCDAERDKILEARKAWEQREKDRIAAHQAKMDELQGILDTDYSHDGLEALERGIDNLQKLSPTADFEEFMAPAVGLWDKAMSKLHSAHIAREKYEAEQAELERLRAAEKARERQEREAKIAQEAAEKARLEAEAKAKAEAEEAERKAQQEREAAAKREADAKAAIEAAERAKAEAEEREILQKQRAEEAAKEAERQRLADIEAAQVRAKQQAEAEKRAEEEAAKKREDNKRHRAKINNESRSDLEECGLSESEAKSVVTAIAQGKIRNVKITY